MAIIDIRHRNAPSINPGSNWLYGYVNFNQDTPTGGDDYKMFEIKTNWIINNSFYRVKTAGDGGSTMEVGTTQNGGEIATGASIASAGNTTQGLITPAAVSVFTSDGFVWLEPSATQHVGEVELLIEVIVPNSLTEL